MLLVLYTQAPDNQPGLFDLNNKLDALMPLLPKSRQEKYQRLRNIQTRATSMLGLLLLEHGMQKLGAGEFSFDELIYSKDYKPRCLNRFDFNISHSHTLATCVLSTSSMVGIDVEKKRAIKHERFERLQLFAGNSLADMSTEDFFTIWTQKEAVVKADGKAAVWNIGEVSVCGDRANFREKTWLLRSIDMPDGYIATVAHDSQSENDDINVLPISVNTLISSMQN